MEDAKKQCLGDAAGSPNGAVQLGQGPVKLLCLLRANCDGDFALLLVCHSVRPHAARGVGPHLPVEDKRTQSEMKKGMMNRNRLMYKHLP